MHTLHHDYGVGNVDTTHYLLDMHQADIFIFVLPIGFAQLWVFEHICALCNDDEF